MPDPPFDAIIVGAGHNGLVAGFYLARAGLRTLILERRGIVGGACVTEEFAPGFRASTGAYVLSMLREAIWQDMRLEQRGLRVDPAGPTLNLYPDDAHYYLSDDMAKTVAETRRFSVRDARAMVAFEDHLAALAKAVVPLFDRTPPDLRLLDPRRDLPELVRSARIGFRHRRDALDLAFLFATSVTQFLGERFGSEHVMAALGWHAINDSIAGPSTPGTAYVLLHDHAGESADGTPRAWGFVRGGMGQVTSLLADAAREAGAQIRTGAEVERILTAGGRATGVALAGGEEIPAHRVVSNADPKRTFLSLLEERDLPAAFRAMVSAYRCAGTSMKINLALAGLPQAAGLPAGGVQPYHGGILEINPFIADMDAQQAGARAGIPADPAHIEICFPTVHDPTLAPEGSHIATIDVASQPYQPRDREWDAIKEASADAAIAQIATHFPDLPSRILHRQVLTPLDLERRLGITGGHALHGDMAPDQLLFMRPVRGYADYRTPVAGLYLCGAGTHPGGGVTGANGRNAAREILRDARHGGSRLARRKALVP
ncbi:MAG TPA: NAD(P)/FAD-dependent oxidoreductase [Streptosporangiaceae bacterium]